MHYYTFNQYLKKQFGAKVRRISLNAGFSCPNKDGSLSIDGCIFCNEAGFSVFPEKVMPLKGQIEKTITETKKKYGNQKFIAYFQNAAGTNAAVEELKTAYDSIKDYPEIVGLSISTRPDCVNEEKLSLIAEYTDKYEVWVEYGFQTIHNKTLKAINRGHTFEQVLDAVNKTHSLGIKVGVHIILGLPGETLDDMLATARVISQLPVSGVKIHVLHVLKNTKLEEQYHKGDIKLFSQEEYVKTVCSFLECLKEECVILRIVSDAKKEYLIAPEWINNKQNVIKEIEEEFVRRGTRQGFLLAG
ncbi:MAG: TIGR01212 family radical SAM protein [Candidatus Omnitrophota bacterium]